MTSAAFDRLLYTDCRPGTGRGAGGGFQVQAQSAGVDSTQSAMAVGWLLYDMQDAWVVRRRPVEEFPLGFAHACEAGYGTAQGRYLGKVTAGGRDGNHLTDCLLTRDPDVYGPTRPAQLWRSALWRDRAWDTPDCPPFQDVPPLGPLTAEAVASWLAGHPDRAQVLARLVSVLERPGRRVVIVSAGPDEAMRWIAAATLLLPVQPALQVSFKVFCSNLQTARQRVVAVPRELNPQVVPGRRESAFVLDAEGCRSDEAEVSARARYWVGQFAAADPYDVVDAVELADALAAGHPGDELDAARTAWAVTVPCASAADLPALLRWLAAAGPQSLAAHGPAVIGAVMAAEPPPGALRWIDGAAAAGLADVDRPAVRRLLLGAEVAEIRAGGAPPTVALPPVDVGADARRDADSEISSAILLGSDAEAEALLRLAWRHAIEPKLAPLQERLSVFVAGWLEKPLAGYDAQHWALHEEILDLAQAELRDRLAERGPDGISEALATVWPYFTARRSDLADPLACHLHAVELRSLRTRQRTQHVRILLDAAIRDTPPAAAAPVLADLQRALLWWGVIEPPEALAVLLMPLPPSVMVEPAITDLAVIQLQRRVARPDSRLLGDLRYLRRCGADLSAPPLPGLLATDDEVTEFLEQARGVASPRHVRELRPALKRLSQGDLLVLRQRVPDLLQVCLECPEPALGSALLGALPLLAARPMAAAWAAGLRRPGDEARTVVRGVSWLDDPDVPEELKALIAEAIQDVLAGLSIADREEWAASVQPMLTPSAARLWLDLVAGGARPRWGLRPRAKRGK